MNEAFEALLRIFAQSEQFGWLLISLMMILVTLYLYIRSFRIERIERELLERLSEEQQEKIVEAINAIRVASLQKRHDEQNQRLSNEAFVDMIGLTPRHALRDITDRELLSLLLRQEARPEVDPVDAPKRWVLADDGEFVDLDR